MDEQSIYEMVVDAVRQALADEAGGGKIRIAKRMVEGDVIFKDADDREVKKIEAAVFFKKVTSVREQLRVLEQKINNNPALPAADKAELQAHITRCYGTLTTFNFLFREEADHFKGAGGKD